MMASAAVSSQQRPPLNSALSNLNTNAVGASGQATSTSTKQLMQLMDSLKRLTDENAQLMREVEDAKTACAEAKAAKNMVAKFKEEYTQRFTKVKEALKKSPMNASPDNPVANRYVLKLAFVLQFV